MRRVLILAGVLVGCLVVAVGFFLAMLRNEPAPAPLNDAAPMPRVAPAEPPDSDALPLVGASETDLHGYPLQTPDLVALRALLHARRFDALTRHIESFQAAFEDDFRKEYWPIRALDAFDAPDPALEPLLAAWIEDEPESWVPLAARARYWLAVALHRRGAAWSRQTPEASFVAMERFMALAREDMDEALKRHPRLVAMHRTRLQISMHRPDDAENKAAIKEALEVCPACFQIRVTRLYSLFPRWGGSRAEMDAFVQESVKLKDQNPRLALLPGYLALEAGDGLLHEKEAARAVEAYSEAVALGPHWEFHAQRARAHREAGQSDLALADLNASLRLSPHNPRALHLRGQIKLDQDLFEEAAQDLLTTARLDPSLHGLAFYLQSAHIGLTIQALSASQRKMPLEAGRLCAMVRQLDPSLRQQDLCDIVLDDAQADGVRGIIDLWRRVIREPDNFDAYRDLDYALVPLRRFYLIEALWDDFIERHPDEAHAFLERSGTRLHLRKFPESIKDAEQACALGEAQGCAQARQIRAKLGELKRAPR